MNHQFRVYAPAVLLVLLGFLVAFQFIKPAPPDRVVMASGGPQGAYHAFAQAYAKRLAAEGIALEVLNTAGSVENIRLLREGKVQVALVQGGIEDRREGRTLNSLGSLFYEPMWLFTRAGLSMDRLTLIGERRVAIGAPGSGTRALAIRLLRDNGLDTEAENVISIGGAEAARALAAGEIDAAFFVSSPENQVVAGLLENPGVTLASFERSDAYARRYRFLTSLELPEGAIDLQRNIPPRSIRLLAPAANLVVDSDVHPAVTDLLLQAAEQVHGDGAWFERRGQFPLDELLAYPLSREAERYYRYGPPFLQRYLPFWAASLLDRLKVMLLPLVLMLLPLFKVMPPIYSWRMRARIYRWYDQLEQVENTLASGGADRKALATRLDDIETEVLAVHVPLSFASQLYHLRQHIDLVRERVGH